MTKHTQLHPETWTWSKGMSYAQGVELGDTVYVSGQVSICAEGQIVCDSDDMTAQSRQLFKNIEIILARWQLMNRQPDKKPPLASLIREMIDHLDQAESYESAGDHDQALWEFAMAEEYRDMCLYRTESEGSKRT